MDLKQNGLDRAPALMHRRRPFWSARPGNRLPRATPSSLELHRRRQGYPARVADRDVQSVSGGGRIVDLVEQVLDVELIGHRQIVDLGVVSRKDVRDGIGRQEERVEGVARSVTDIVR